MKTSFEDTHVADCVTRLGFGLRELLQHALSGKDPNNILGRLVRRKLIQSVRGALPRNRAYYLPAGEKPLGGQALRQRLALTWHVLRPPKGIQRVRLRSDELADLFQLQTPLGPHVLEQNNGQVTVRHIYVAMTQDVVAGVKRHLARAQTFPRVARAIDASEYGFTVLVPWTYSRTQELGRALRGEHVAGLSRFVEPGGAKFVVERSPGVESLGLALKELKGAK